MNGLILFFAIFILFVLFIIFIAFLLVRGTGRSYGKQYLLHADNIGNLVMKKLARKRPFYKHGNGIEAQPSGLKKKPISISKGIKQFPFANATLTITGDMLELLNLDYKKKFEKLNLDHSKAVSENASLKSELIKEKTQRRGLVQEYKNELIADHKKLQPFLDFKKNKSKSTGGGYNG